MKKIVQTGNAPKPVGAYSQAVRAGKFLFVSGQLAIDPKEGKIAADNIIDQTRISLENIKAILEAEAYHLSDVVQTNVYFSSVRLFKDFNSEYKKYFHKSPQPESQLRQHWDLTLWWKFQQLHTKNDRLGDSK